MGKWIIVDDTEHFIARCSERGKNVDSRRLDKFLFCPKCKTKMENIGGLTMNNNKMTEVAALFGKKLGELFKVRHVYCVGEYTACFTKNGYMVKTARDSWKDDSLLVSLILGMSVIVDD